MASLRELKTKWQIRYYDGSRDPKRTTDLIDKAEYTESEAESEAEYRQQLYDRGRYDPWTQADPAHAGMLPTGFAMDMDEIKAYTRGRSGLDRFHTISVLWTEPHGFAFRR